jgi:hypothetical protein
MLDVSVEANGLIEKFGSMIKKLGEFPKHMGDELTDWQVQDMHRHYPNTETPDENTVETDIWPTSRTTDLRNKKKVKKIMIARKRQIGRKIISGKTGILVRSKIQRPILRLVLYEKLVKRMDDLMTEQLTWQ